jgi:hypothetical protein
MEELGEAQGTTSPYLHEGKQPRFHQVLRARGFELALA